MAVVYSKVLLFDPPLIYTAPDICVFGAVNFLGILSEWGPDPPRHLPNFYLSDFFFFFSKILGHPKQMIETFTPLPH